MARAGCEPGTIDTAYTPVLVLAPSSSAPAVRIPIIQDDDDGDDDDDDNTRVLVTHSASGAARRPTHPPALYQPFCSSRQPTLSSSARLAPFCFTRPRLVWPRELMATAERAVPVGVCVGFAASSVDQCTHTRSRHNRSHITRHQITHTCVHQSPYIFASATNVAAAAATTTAAAPPAHPSPCGLPAACCLA